MYMIVCVRVCVCVCVSTPVSKVFTFLFCRGRKNLW